MPTSMAGRPAARPMRRLPLSPPDVDYYDPPASPPAHYVATSPERTRFQPRRTSTLSYQQSGVRDMRDGSYSRSTRNLLVVIPPPDFPLHQGQLGSVLSMGPRHRLTQGILMPLFPSMHGQLNAIAREYNFPTTVGLCLYLHINENGILMTPRISDDSWQYLFGHLFEARLPSGAQQLPIGGSIEFDIDLNKARWFDAWVSGALRDQATFLPSHVPLGNHWREGVHPARVDDHPVDDPWEASASHTLVNNSRPSTLRHLPKKLSLVDRLESQGHNAPLTLQTYPDRPDTPQTHGLDNLSPAPQTAMPPVANRDLERRVNSWRASTELYSVSMAEAYRPVPDVRISQGVTSMDKYALDCDYQQGVNLDHYLWAGTSLGPRTPDMNSAIASSHPSSVHLDRRANGTVPLTPTTATSWGPADKEWRSTVSTVSRLPSPDMGERVVEDTLAPRRHSVWGNSFGWRSATTWKDVYPYAATTQAKPVIQVQLRDPNGLVSQYPNLVIYPPVAQSLARPQTSTHSVWGSSFGWQTAVTWRTVYPYSTVTIKPLSPIRLPAAGGLVSKYPNLCIYPTTYPFLEIYPICTVKEDMTQPVSGVHTASNKLARYPNLVIFPAVYPHFDIYPPIAGSIHVEEPNQPNTSIYSMSVVSNAYPHLVVYPAVYPHINIYPSIAGGIHVKESDLPNTSAHSSSLVPNAYPYLVIYPTAYPHFDMYPPVAGSVHVKEESNQLNTSIHSLSVVSNAYPHLVIYPPAYPYFDLYPKLLQISEARQDEVDVKLANAGGLAGEYPNMTIYPSVYPHLDIYPLQVIRKQTPSLTWAVSFGWLTAKTWLQVYPLHIAEDSDRSKSRSRSQNQAVADIGVRKQAIWGDSFGWKNAMSWRAVWPSTHARVQLNVDSMSVHSSQRSNLSSNYPFLCIYPAAYPNFDIYPSRAGAVEIKTSGAAEHAECSVELVPHYPNLVIYPAVYPHMDIYPPFAKALTVTKKQASVLHRRIEMWRARTAAQVPLIGLLANNHFWEADEPLRIDTADYAWSRTSAGPSSPLESPFTLSISGSVHIDRRIRGSVLLTPSTATTWGPPDDDRFSDIGSIERLPSPDLGQRMLDDAENPMIPRQQWDLVSPFFNGESQVDDPESIREKSVFIRKYAYQVIYPPAYPHFNLYPALANVSALSVQATKALDSSCSIYSFIYPHFDIYPAVDSKVEVPGRTVSNVWHEQVKVRLPTPDSAMYHAHYPYNLNFIYPHVKPIESGRTPTKSRGYPCLVIYPPVYPFIIPYPAISAEVRQTLKSQQSPVMSSPEQKSINVKLPIPYPTIEIYPACYPRSLSSIYPAISVDDFPGVMRPQYPFIQIYAPVYPFVQPYPTMAGLGSVHIPGSLDKEQYEAANAFSKFMERTQQGSVMAYPYFDLYPATCPQHQERAVQDTHMATPLGPSAGDGLQLKRIKQEYAGIDLHPALPMLPPSKRVARDDARIDVVVTSPPEKPTKVQRTRMTHMELHALVFRCLEKKRARNLKTHQELHVEVFRDGIVWTPSGYTQDISSLTQRRRDMPAREVQARRPSQEMPTPRAPRPILGTVGVQAPLAEKVVFPLSQPPVAPPLSPFRVRSPSVPSQPLPAVSETPMPRVSSPTNGFTHRQSASVRLSQAVKSMMPGAQRRNSSAVPVDALPEEPKEPGSKDHHQPPTRFLSLADRRQSVVPPLPHAGSPAFLSRIPQVSHRKESLVLQRARAYERSGDEHDASRTRSQTALFTGTSFTSTSAGTKGTQSSFILPPLTPMASMADVMDTFDISKISST